MHLTPDDAASIYARACRAWYGKRALSVVTDRLRALRQRGDAGGVAAWARVADILARKKAPADERDDGVPGKLY